MSATDVADQDAHPNERSPFAEFERKRWQEEAGHVICPECGSGAGRHMRTCSRQERASVTKPAAGT